MRVLSLGAGVQSTTLALLAVEGVLPKPDCAIFADTGWEPAAVYRQLDKIENVLTAAGVAVYRVSSGDLRRDTIETTNFIRLPAFVRGGDGSAAILRRQCTERYKVTPIKRQVRLLLGAKRSKSGAVLSPPPGQTAEQWIGFSTDEIGRVSGNKHDSAYLRSTYPLLELGMSRKDCERWLAARGWGDTAKSACIGCPFHGNRAWRELRDKRPDEWADAVEFDRMLRERRFRGPQGQPYLHRSLLPLDQAPIDRVTRRENNENQTDIFDQIAEMGDPDGCSPYGCRSGEAG